MIEWFTRNSVAANLLMVSILLGGLLALNQTLILEIFPTIESRSISINVVLRGATPEDVERGVAVRIEEAIQDIEGIRQIISESREGSTSVGVEVELGYDARDILADIKSRVDSINTFPAEAEKPVISLNQYRRAVIDVTVSGTLSEAEIREYADALRDDLGRLPDVSMVEMNYPRRYEISIEVSQDRLRDTGLSLNQVATEIRNNSLDSSAGNLRAEGGDVLIRSRGQAYRKDEFEAIVVKTNADGSIVRLGDVAVVNDGFEEDSVLTKINGSRGAVMRVMRTGDESPLVIAKAVREFVAERRANLPAGLELGTWDDDSKILKSRLGTMFGNLWQGSILVILLLTLFLRPAVALWVFIGIPISFIGSFMIFGQLGITINIMSLYGFILVIGLVVDDAIVTGESIYVTMSEGGDPTQAAIDGTRRVAIPVTFGVLTTIAAFLPIANMKGFMGEMMAAVPIVIGSILLFSLIESKFVLPAHLKNVRPYSSDDELSGFARWQQNFAKAFEGMILKYYRPLLARAVEHRYSVLATFLGVFLVVCALLMKGWMPFTFMPRIPSETVRASLTMPAGTPISVTQRHIDYITEAANLLQEKYSDEDGNSSIATIMSVAGASRRSSGTNIGRVSIETLPVEERPVIIDTTEISREWRKLIGTIPGAESLSYRAEMIRFGDPINIQLSGNSLETLGAVADKIKERLATYSSVYEISDSLSNGKEELRIELTEQGHVLGLTRSSILRQLSQSFKGFEAQRIQRGRDDIRVLVRLPLSERSSRATLNELLITTPSGALVPLAQVADVKPGRGPAQIKRVDRFRVVNVTADFEKETTNATALNADLQAYLDELLLNYPGIDYTLQGEAREQRDTTDSLFLGAAFLLFVIYTLLALPLKSYTQPIVVMSIIPFALIGAVLGHYIMGLGMVMLSYFGLLGLTGVVVNDSLVLVDFINQSKRKGMELKEAVLNAGVARFRAVMLTSLTTFFGLLPMMFATSTQSLFLVPMAVSLGFGILFATCITLVLVPCNTMIGDDIRRAWRALFRSAFSKAPA